MIGVGTVYVVTAPVCVVKDSVGKLRYVYQDGQLPDGIPLEELQRHLDSGMIAAFDLPDVIVDIDPEPVDPGVVDDVGETFHEPPVDPAPPPADLVDPVSPPADLDPPPADPPVTTTGKGRRS